MKILLFTDCSVGVIGYHVDHAIALKKAGVDIFAVVSSKDYRDLNVTKICGNIFLL